MQRVMKEDANISVFEKTCICKFLWTVSIFYQCIASSLRTENALSNRLNQVTTNMSCVIHFVT